jgi:hypothetical protein
MIGRSLAGEPRDRIRPVDPFRRRTIGGPAVVPAVEGPPIGLRYTLAPFGERDTPGSVPRVEVAWPKS